MRTINELFNKWIKILRLENNWDVKLELINDERFIKTGDFKVDPDDRKAILKVKDVVYVYDLIMDIINGFSEMMD